MGGHGHGPPGSHEIVVASGTKFPEKVAGGERLENAWKRFPWAAFVQDYRIPGGFRIDQMRKSRSEERGNVCRTRAGIY